MRDYKRQQELRKAKRGQPVPPGVQHGKVYAVKTYGCACKECRAYSRPESRWTERRRRYAGQPVPEGLPHGPNTWARRAYRCECADCVNPEKPRPLTFNERQQKLRRDKKGKPVPQGTRHGIYAYRTYGCRCEVCRAAQKATLHRRRNPWMYRPTRGRWREENGVTTLCWPPAGAGDEWTCPCELEVA